MSSFVRTAVPKLLSTVALLALNWQAGFGQLPSNLAWNPSALQLQLTGVSPVGRSAVTLRDTFSFYFRSGKWQQYLPLKKGKEILIGFKSQDQRSDLVSDGRTGIPEGFPPDFEHPQEVFILKDAYRAGPYANFGTPTELQQAVNGTDITEKEKALHEKLADAKLLDKLMDLADIGIVLDLRTSLSQVEYSWLEGKWECWPTAHEQVRYQISHPPTSYDPQPDDETFVGTVVIDAKGIRINGQVGKLKKSGERWVARLKDGRLASVFPEQDDVNHWIYISVEDHSGDVVRTKTVHARKLD